MNFGSYHYFGCFLSFLAVVACEDAYRLPPLTLATTDDTTAYTSSSSAWPSLPSDENAFPNEYVPYLRNQPLGLYAHNMLVGCFQDITTCQGTLKVKGKIVRLTSAYRCQLTWKPQSYVRLKVISLSSQTLLYEQLIPWQVELDNVPGRGIEPVAIGSSTERFVRKECSL